MYKTLGPSDLSALLEGLVKIPSNLSDRLSLTSPTEELAVDHQHPIAISSSRGKAEITYGVTTIAY